MIVTKMPKKRNATSLIGSHVNPLSSRTAAGVEAIDTRPITTMSRSRTRLRYSKWMPNHWSPGVCQTPGQQHRAENAEQQQEVVRALDRNDVAGAAVVGRPQFELPPDQPRVDDEEDREHDGRRRSRYWGSRRSVQKNGTPCRKPRNSGGSPSGVSRPPMFATRKMKNTKTWALCRRQRVRPQQRPDEQHRGARRAHQRREHEAGQRGTRRSGAGVATSVARSRMPPETV